MVTTKGSIACKSFKQENGMGHSYLKSFAHAWNISRYRLSEKIIKIQKNSEKSITILIWRAYKKTKQGHKTAIWTQNSNLKNNAESVPSFSFFLWLDEIKPTQSWCQCLMNLLQIRSIRFINNRSSTVKCKM